MLKETPLPTTVRPRHYQKLSERLRQFMAENHFRDGDKLPPERALAESFGVSRNSVREAIHALAERGLLESRHGDGTYVRVPDMEPLRSAILEAVDSEGHLFDEVMEYRRILEPAVAELAALRRTPEQLDRLKIIACDQQRRILIDGDDGELDAQFHLCLAECSGNRLLINTVALLNEQYAGGRTADLRDASWHQFSVLPTCASLMLLSGSPLKIAAKPSKNISIPSFTNTFSSQQGTSKMTAISTLCLRGTVAESLSTLRHQGGERAAAPIGAHVPNPYIRS